MHRGHDHHHYDVGGSSAQAVISGAGHNQPTDQRHAAQWQTPHREHNHGADDTHDRKEPDLDLVEIAFVEGFLDAKDSTSFLRLAQVPFEATAVDGARLALLRVEIDAFADVGSVTPHLGGASFRYDPLPSRMVSRRKRLRFVYFDGSGLRQLDLSQVRLLRSAVDGHPGHIPS